MILSWLQTQLKNRGDDRLTNVINPAANHDLGAVAMRMLTKLMNHEELAVKNIILPHGYIDRDSTK